MKLDKCFATKVALLNAVPFAGITVGITYVDGLLANHVVPEYQCRHYPLGYWIALGAIPVFLATYVPLLLCKRRDCLRTAIVWPPLMMLLAGMLSLFNFLQEFPHSGIVVWIVVYAAAALITSFARLASDNVDSQKFGRIDLSNRSDWIRENAAFWRTAAVGLIIAYVGVIAVWIQGSPEFGKWITTDQTEAFRLVVTITNELALFTVVFVLGPVYECFRAAYKVTDSLIV